MTTLKTEIFFIPCETKSPTYRKQLDKFDEWFSQCHNTLHFMACLILGASEMAETAVQSCRLRAFRHPRVFESQGAFRGWVLRLLIAEALSIRCRAA